MKPTRNRFLALLAIPALAAGLAGGTSQARSILPSAGRAVNAADYGCFGLGGSTMTNYCSTMKVLEIPLVVDGSPSGWYTVTVTAQGATPSNNVGCKSFGMSKDAMGFVSGDPRRFLTAFGVAQDLTTSAWTPGGGGIFVNCEVAPEARVNMVNW